MQKRQREWKLERYINDDDVCRHHMELCFLCDDRDIKSVTFYFYSHYLYHLLKPLGYKVINAYSHVMRMEYPILHHCVTFANRTNPGI